MEHISTTIPKYLDNLDYKRWRADRDYWQQFAYKKPIYDPFEVFKPTKTFLKEVTKQLKQQCYEIIKEKQTLNQQDYPDWIKESIRERMDGEHQQLFRRIKDYTYRIKHNNGSDAADPGRITESDKQRAKEVSISNYYTGKLVRSNNRLLGKCPFHDDSTASFVIYPTNTFHCFGCQINGDVISFVQKTNNLKFIEAIKFLLNK